MRTAAVHLWTFLVDNFYDPISFALEFHVLKKHLSTTVEAIVSVLEVSSGMEGVVVVGQTDTIVSENVEAAQEVKKI